ncbi:MAG: flippase-like domain-containing protein, partial [Dehalococcoidia bacterium]|nr:flippase-like domain-containing protein [Dehalococcoidia bacterium]
VYGIRMGILVVLTLKTYLVAQLLEIPVTISGAFLLCTASTVARVVSIFPGGLGIVEAAMSATYVILGGNLESGILLSVVDRIINLIATVIMGGSWLLFSRKQIGLFYLRKR